MCQHTTQMLPLPGTRKVGIGPLPSFVKPPSEGAEAELTRAMKAVLNAKKIAVVVGAGISTAANIPDFRSSTGLFASLKARFPNAKLTSGRDLFDINAWKDPDTLSLHFGMLAELHKMCEEAQPTAFHQFLKQLDDEGRLSRVYTQNIDGLEEKVGLTYGIPGAEDASVSSRFEDPGTTYRKPSLKRKRGQVFPPNLPPTPRSTPSPPDIREDSTSIGEDSNPLSGFQRDGSVSSSALSDYSSSAPPSSQLSSVSTICPDAPSMRIMNTPPSKVITRATAAAAEAQTNVQQRPVKPKPVDPFPRVIPLHGTLKNLSCPSCKHSVSMSDYIGPLAEGETIFCPQCQIFDDARALSGFRTRGVSVLKSGVVLYGEEHSEGDRVGAVTSRDLMRGRRPDLLIVAGTSLKVPGTKRLVKELSKVIRPPVKASSDSQDEGDEEEGCPARIAKKPRAIHTIFLNNEFPSPCTLWKDTFDVWVKGNVDQFIRMIDDERKSQEELKLRKAQEKVEREKKKEEKFLKAVQESQGIQSCKEKMRPTAPIAPKRAAAVSCNINKAHPNPKAKGQLGTFFKTSKFNVAPAATLISNGKGKGSKTSKGATAAAKTSLKASQSQHAGTVKKAGRV